MLGSKRYRASLRFVVFDVPILLGKDLRDLPWQDRRERAELLAHAFAVPLALSPLVDPSVGLFREMSDGRLEGIVLKDRMSTYRDGSRAGWTKVKGSELVRARGLAVRPSLMTSGMYLR